MYAVIRTGGKQVRLTPGASVRVEKLAGEVGDSIAFDQVLLMGGEGETRVGRPLVEGAVVSGTITAQGRGPKIVVFNSTHLITMKPMTHMMRTRYWNN